MIKGGKDRLDHVNEGPRYSYLVNFQLNRLYLDDVWCKAAVNLLKVFVLLVCQDNVYLNSMVSLNSLEQINSVYRVFKNRLDWVFTQKIIPPKEAIDLVYPWSNKYKNLCLLKVNFCSHLPNKCSKSPTLSD